MIETIGRIYVIDNGEVAIEWIHEKNPLFGNKSEYYISHSHTGDTLATFKTRKALVASYEAAQELSTLLEIREMLITKTYLSRLGSAKSPKKATAARANGAKGGRPMSTTSALEKIQNGAEPESLRFICEADDGQGNSYWVRRQGATIIRLNRFEDNETGNIEWSDDVSGWEK